MEVIEQLAKPLLVTLTGRLRIPPLVTAPKFRLVGPICKEQTGVIPVAIKLTEANGLLGSVS